MSICRMESIITQHHNTYCWYVGSWLPAKLDTRLSRIGLAALILHAVAVGPTGGSAVISGHYDKCYSL